MRDRGLHVRSLTWVFDKASSLQVLEQTLAHTLNPAYVLKFK